MTSGPFHQVPTRTPTLIQSLAQEASKTGSVDV